MNLELVGNPDIYKIKVYSRYKIQALTLETPERIFKNDERNRGIQKAHREFRPQKFQSFESPEGNYKNGH